MAVHLGGWSHATKSVCHHLFFAVVVLHVWYCVWNSWKASVMAKVAPLFELLFKVCSNGVLPTLKLVQCLQKMHLSKPIYHDSSEPVTKFAPDCGAILRMVAKHFRTLAKSSEKLDTCLKQA